MELNSKENISTNLIWRLFERFGAQAVSFIVSIIVARLLEPGVYGIIALVTVFTSIMQVFVDSGLGNALIQKKEADEEDFSTVFWFNVVFCIILYGIMFAISPFIAEFYQMPTLVPVVRVLSLTIIVSGLKNVQQAYVSRNMLFKKFFFATLGGTIGAAFVGITLAFCGWGVWALVLQSLFNTIVDTIILWFFVRWRPMKVFNVNRLKVLFDYGWKLLVAKLIDTIFEDIRSLVIGKKYSSTDLGLYNKGKQFPSLIVGNISSAIDSVLFPSMSMEQDKKDRVRLITSKAITTTAYLVLPIMVGMAACADSLVSIVLTDKWIECVPYMRIFCIALSMNPILIANLNAINAVGRSDIYLKLEVFRKVIGMMTLVALMRFGVKAIAISYLLNCTINMIVNSHPNKRLLNYGFVDQMRDIAPTVGLSAIMGLIVYIVKFFNIAGWITLIIQIVVGISVYLCGSIVLKNDSYLFIKGMLVPYITKKAKT